jgi:hypothetical protein
MVLLGFLSLWDVSKISTNPLLSCCSFCPCPQPLLFCSFCQVGLGLW